MKRIISTLLALCLCAALACPAFAADHEMNEDNNWNISGELIMPGESFYAVQEVVNTFNPNGGDQGRDREDVIFNHVSLDLTYSSFSSEYLRDKSTEISPSGLSAYGTAEKDLLTMYGTFAGLENVQIQEGLTSFQTTFTAISGYKNNTGLPIRVVSYNKSGGISGGGLVSRTDDKDVYIYWHGDDGFGFDVYEEYYTLSYGEEFTELLTADQIAALPDRYRYYISNEENTLTLPILQKPGAVFTGYWGLPGEPVFDYEAGTVTYTYDWAWLNAAEQAGDYSIEDHTFSPEFDAGHTIHFYTDGGLLSADYLEVGMSDAADFDLYSYIPVRAGCTCIGWSERKDDPGYLISSDYELNPNYSSDKAFYAIWVENEKLASWGMESALQALSRLGDYSCRYDADGDRDVTTYDAALFLQLAVGQIDRLPAYTSKNA